MSRTRPSLSLRLSLAGLLLVGAGLTGCEKLKEFDQKAMEAADKAKSAGQEAQKTVEDVAGTVKAAADVVKKLQELAPVSMSHDAKAAAETFRSDLGIAPPSGYEGAARADIALPGEAEGTMAVVVPKGASVASLLGARADGLRITPGEHTVLASARLPVGSPTLLRHAIAGLSNQGDGPIERKSMKVAGKEVAYYEQRLSTGEGDASRAVFVFAGDGRVLHAVGPAQGFDDKALRRAVAGLVKAHSKSDSLYELPEP